MKRYKIRKLTNGGFSRITIPDNIVNANDPWSAGTGDYSYNPNSLTGILNEQNTGWENYDNKKGNGLNTATKILNGISSGLSKSTNSSNVVGSLAESLVNTGLNFVPGGPLISTALGIISGVGNAATAKDLNVTDYGTYYGSDAAAGFKGWTDPLGEWSSALGRIGNPEGDTTEAKLKYAGLDMLDLLAPGIASGFTEYERNRQNKKDANAKQLEENRKIVDEKNKAKKKADALDLTRDYNNLNSFFSIGGIINDIKDIVQPLAFGGISDNNVPDRNSISLNGNADLIVGNDGSTEGSHEEGDNIPVLGPNGIKTGEVEPGEVVVTLPNGKQFALSKRLGISQMYLELNDARKQLIQQQQSVNDTFKKNTISREIDKIDKQLNSLPAMQEQMKARMGLDNDANQFANGGTLNNVPVTQFGYSLNEALQDGSYSPSLNGALLELRNDPVITKNVNVKENNVVFANGGTIGDPPKGKKNVPDYLMWNDPELDAPMRTLGYSIGDNKTRFKLLDYMEKNGVLPDKFKNMSFGEIDNIKNILNNYDAFTEDTAMNPIKLYNGGFPGIPNSLLEYATIPDKANFSLEDYFKTIGVFDYSKDQQSSSSTPSLNSTFGDDTDNMDTNFIRDKRYVTDVVNIPGYSVDPGEYRRKKGNVKSGDPNKQINTSKLKDALAGIDINKLINSAGEFLPLFDNLYNAQMIKKTPELHAPDLYTYDPISEKYDISASVNSTENAGRRLAKFAAENSGSIQDAIARINDINQSTTSNVAQLYQTQRNAIDQKHNINIQGINRINQLNTDQMNSYYDEQTKRRAGILQDLSRNAANMADDITGILTRRDMRNYQDKQIALDTIVNSDTGSFAELLKAGIYNDEFKRVYGKDNLIKMRDMFKNRGGAEDVVEQLNKLIEDTK